MRFFPIFSVLFLCLSMTACVTNAEGPAFNSQPQVPAPSGYTHIYVFRDKVLYLAQAPYITRTRISIDGRLCGSLANGGYLVINLAPGRHTIAASSDGYETVRDFESDLSGSGYVEITDLTRMAGARLLAEAAVGGITAKANAEEIGEGRKQTRLDVIEGALTAISDDGFPTGAERVWGISLPDTDDAQIRLYKLLKSIE
jgi:hypothetical protein